MKKSILLAFFACFSACVARAEVVTPAMAMAAADAWAERNAQFDTGNNATNVITVCDTNAAQTVLWHQVSMAGGGCLMIAPVTEIEPVVMALDSDPGELPAAHPLRAILRGDMRRRLRFLKLYEEDAPSGGGRRRLAAGASGAQPVEEEDENVAAVREEWAAQQQSKWERLRKPGKGGKARLGVGVKEGVTDADMPIKVVVKGFELNGPLTHWNQSTPENDVYNLYTPSHSVCGCVATAMSAMMQFFRVAETDSTKIEANQSNSDCTFNGGPVPGGATTMGGVYDWSKFDSCTSLADYSHLSSEQKEILGRVAYDAGVGVGMQWTVGASGALEKDIATAFTKYFKFHEVRYVDNPTQDQYAKLIYAQCRSNAPVGLGIEQHSVVAVGYGIDGDGVERVRVFMGWGGMGDGWYALPYIDTKSTSNGSNYLSEIVDGVITLIGYQDDSVVPVCGRLLPYMNADMKIGGFDTQADANGFFGLRVSAKDTQNKQVEVVCNSGSKSKVGSVSVGSDPGKDSGNISSGMGICRWVPDPILFPLLNSDVALGFVDAREKAIASITNGTPKPVLAFSGNWSELPTIAAWDYLSGLDEANGEDFTNKFVVLCTPFSLDNLSESDGNPSIGVFDGRAISAAPNKIWSFYNGRLSYWSIGGSIFTNVENQVDGDIREFYVTNSVDGAGFIVTNSIEELLAQETDIIDAFEYNGNVPARYITGWGITNAVMNVFDVGLDNFMTRVADIPVTITNLDFYAPVPPPAMAPELEYGTYMTSNGVEYVSSVPEFVTNAEQNVEYKCWGNIFFVTNLTDGSVYAETNENVTVQAFTTVKDYAYKVTWFWEISKVKITTDTIDGDWNRGVGRIEPGTGWFPANTRVTFKAVPPDSTPGESWYFANWMIDQENHLADNDMYSEFGSELTVFVERPVTIKAMFGCETESPDWGSFNLVVTNVCLKFTGGGPVGFEARLASKLEQIVDGSALTNGEIVATAAPNTLHNSVVLENNATNVIQKFGIAPMSLAANSVTGTDGQSYVCCGWLVTRHVSEYNIRKEVWEDKEVPVDVAYLSDDDMVTVDGLDSENPELKMNYALQPTVAGIRTGNSAVYEYEYPVCDNDTLTLTWLWKPGKGDDTSKIFNIEWDDSLSNLSYDYTTNLITVADMVSKGWALTDLVVTTPLGWRPVVDVNGEFVVANLVLDEEALSKAMESCDLTIIPNTDGTITVQAAIVSALRGFWYVLYGSDDLDKWEPVADGVYESGLPAARGSTKNPVGPITLSITVTPGDTGAGVKRFYKVVSGATQTPLTTY